MGYIKCLELTMIYAHKNVYPQIKNLSLLLFSINNEGRSWIFFDKLCFFLFFCQ